MGSKNLCFNKFPSRAAADGSGTMLRLQDKVVRITVCWVITFQLHKQCSLWVCFYLVLIFFLAIPLVFSDCQCLQLLKRQKQIKEPRTMSFLHCLVTLPSFPTIHSLSFTFCNVSIHYDMPCKIKPGTKNQVLHDLTYIWELIRSSL